MGKSVKEGIMPRESIRSADYNFEPMPEGVPEPFFPPNCRLGQVEVGWSKAPTGHVEISTHDRTMLKVLIEQVTAAVEEGSDVETVMMDYFRPGGFWVTLDRDGCNALIRRIRKARDDAFRRDE